MIMIVMTMMNKNKVINVICNDASVYFMYFAGKVQICILGGFRLIHVVTEQFSVNPNRG